MRARVSCLIFAAGMATLCVAGENPAKRAKTPQSRGLSTPGVRVPFAKLKADAEPELPGTIALAPSADHLLAVRQSGQLDRIDRNSAIADGAITGLGKPCGAVSGFGAVWVADCAKKVLHRVDLKSARIVAAVEAGAGALAASADSIWMLSDTRVTLTRIDPDAGVPVASVRFPEACAGGALAFGESALWLTCPASNRVQRIDPARNVLVKSIETAAGPSAVAIGEGSVWVLGAKEGKISRIDPRTNTVSATIDLGLPGSTGGALAHGEGFLWASSPGMPLMKIAAEGNRVVRQFQDVEFAEGPLAVAFQSVWLGNGRTIRRFDPKRIAATLSDD